MDQVVEYFKPPRCPSSISEEQYGALTESFLVRELRYRIEVPGFRTREVTLVTTLLDGVAYTAESLANLYATRSQHERII